MSGTFWNPLQQSEGGEQPSVGGSIKLFDPTQFQVSHQQSNSQQESAFQPNIYPSTENHQQQYQQQALGQGNASSWSNWGSWNWSTDGQNAQLNGQGGPNEAGYAASNGVAEASACELPEYGVQFYHPQLLQSAQATGDQANQSKLDQQHQMFEGNYNQWGQLAWQASNSQHVQHHAEGQKSVPPGTQFLHLGQNTVPPGTQFLYQNQDFHASSWSSDPVTEAFQSGDWENSIQQHKDSQPHLNNNQDSGTQNSSFALHSFPFNSAGTGIAQKSHSHTDSISYRSYDNTATSAQVMSDPHKSVSYTDDVFAGHTRNISLDSSAGNNLTSQVINQNNDMSFEISANSDARKASGDVGASSTTQYLNVIPIHRTDSVISNTSLQTVNMSADEDSKDIVEDFANRLKLLHLDGNQPDLSGNMLQTQALAQHGNYDTLQDAQKVQMNNVNTSESSQTLSFSAVQSHSDSLDSGIKFTAPPPSQADKSPSSKPSEVQQVKSESNVQASYSSTTQDSESFTAISSSSGSGSVDALSHASFPFSQFYQPSASSTPFTSPGSMSVGSQPSSIPSLQNSPRWPSGGQLVGPATHTATHPPVVSKVDVQTKDDVVKSVTESISIESVADPGPKMSEDSKPPRPPSSSGVRSTGSQSALDKDSTPSSPSRRYSAFHPVHTQRGKHNISPATSLWDNIDATPAANILLAPAAPLVVPSKDISTSTSVSPKPQPLSSAPGKSAEGKSASQGKESRTARQEEERGYRGRRERSSLNKTQSDEVSRSREDDNRSLGSLDEVDAIRDDTDDSRSKGLGRDLRNDSYYDRPSSRSEGYREYYRRPRERESYRYGRDYRDSSYYDEKYDRPRSRQDEERFSRPSSRSGREADQSRSKLDQDRDRDPYYQPQRESQYRGYHGYDSYGQDYYYYNERDRYYRYYTQSRYRQGYAEEMGYYGHPESAEYYGRSSRPPSRLDQDPINTYRLQGYDSYGYGGYYDPYQYQYYYHDQQYVQQGNYQPGRMTPPKYILPHVRTCFGPGGQLVTVLPNRPADGQPAMVEIHDLRLMLENRPELEQLKQFPGPLVKNETHKNDVLVYCQKKAKECAENIDMIDRESAELIWRLLQLLLKQNGTIIGTDIADLLLSGHEPSTHEYSLTGMHITPSSDHLDTPDGDGSSCASSPALRVAAEKSLISATQQLEEATDRFRNLLLYGHKKEALDWAMRHNLWGHALFLASKMDSRTHASIMTRFANTAMRMNDPLQTLYQLMSGRQPASVTNVVDERWGDWRPHLAMVLSNHSSRPDLDKKSIITLGDTLATKRCLHASHFCYLMAQVDFGSFLNKTSKLVLIGSNPNLPLEEFVSNTAVQCTEVYEYAQSLGNSKVFLSQFQVFKFLYACRLADYGLAQEAFHYCERIALQVLLCPARYRPAFISILYALANQLKHSDPEKLHIGHDSADPAWLTQLQAVCQGYEDGSIQFKSGSVTPMAGYGTMTPSSESGEVSSYGMDNGGGVFQQDVSNYSSYNYQQTGGQIAEETMTGDLNQQQQYEGDAHYGQQPAVEKYNQTHYSFNQYQQQTDHQWPQYDYNQAVHGQQQAGLQQQQQPTAVGHYTVNNTSHTLHHQDQYRSPVDGTTLGGYSNYHDQQSNQRKDSLASTTSGMNNEEEDDDVDGEEEVSPESGFGTSQFDYFAAASQQIVAPPHRYRTTSTSSSGSTSQRRRRTVSGSSSNSVKLARGTNPVSKPQLNQQRTTATKKDVDQKGVGGGWLGGLFSKFGRKDKNEMILPDDKNPSIVWDPVKKKWINKDGEEEQSMSMAPPPKDADLMGKMAPTFNPPVPSTESAPAVNGPPVGNRFSRPKARGARGQYVDVLNPQGQSASAAVPSTLFNVLPSVNANTSPHPQLVVPDGAPENTNKVPTLLPNQPSNFLMPSSEDAQEFDKQPSAVQQQPTSTAHSMPIMFNPQQVSQGNSTVGGGTGGPGLKYGHRRVYPK